MAEPNRNIILSHGGKHGAGGTYLKGQPLPAEVVKHVPENLIYRESAPAVPTAPAPKPPAPTPPPAPPAASPPPSNPLPTSQEGPKTAEEPKAEGKAGDAAAKPGDAVSVPPSDKPTIPTSKARLMKMSKEAVIRLATDLGMKLEPTATEKEIKENLARELELQ